MITDWAETELDRALVRGRWREAHALCLGRLASRPQDPAALAGLAAIAEAHDNLVQAEALLARACAAAPAEPVFPARRARLLSLLSRPDDATAAAQAALALGLNDPALLDLVGVVLSRGERHAEAADAFARATQACPGHGPGWRNYAGALRHCGRFAEAHDAYGRAITLDPADAEAWLARVGLRRQRVEDDPTPTLERLWEARGGDPDAALRIGHALAKVAEDLDRRDDAMAWLVRAKADKAAAVAHDPDRTDRLYAAAAATFPVDVVPVAAEEDAGVRGREPAFVVGAPRTGTTLVERILSSHPQMMSIGESPALSLAVKRLSGTRSHRVLDEETLTAAARIAPPRLGREYLLAVGEGPRRTVDKMPLNLLYAGLVHRALPDARIVRLRRHPMDAVLANWRQLFAPRQSFYDHNWSLAHVARWIVAVERLGAHWRAVLPPERYLEVAYEDLVSDQEATTRRLLAFCGLAWEPRCLDFHDNPAPVATASAVQVRQPLHRRSVGAWRAVEPHLAIARDILLAAGLIDAFGQALEIVMP